MNMSENDLLNWVIAGTVVILLLLAAALFKKLGKFIDEKAAATKQGTIEWLALAWAKQAYAYAEKEGAKLTGAEKATLAAQFLSNQLKAAGLDIKPDRIKALVQQAWTLLEGMPRETGNMTTTIKTQADEEQLKKLAEDVVKTEIEKVVQR